MTGEEFILEIERVRAAVALQIDGRQAGERGPGTLAELLQIRDELQNLIREIDRRQPPPAGDRWLTAADIVSDRWDFSEPLGEAIARLNYLYRHELEI